MNESIKWEFTGFEEAEDPNGDAPDDDRYYYTTTFYGVDYYMDVYVTNGVITDHTCSRYLGEPLGYLYESQFKVPRSIAKHVEQMEKQRLYEQTHFTAGISI